MWTACAMSIFQLLSQDYISYAFFIFFLGFALGAIHVIAIPYVMEMVNHHSSLLYHPYEILLLSSLVILERSTVSRC